MSAFQRQPDSLSHRFSRQGHSAPVQPRSAAIACPIALAEPGSGVAVATSMVPTRISSSTGSRVTSRFFTVRSISAPSSVLTEYVVTRSPGTPAVRTVS